MNVSHRKRFFFHLEPNHKPMHTLCVKHEEINARKRGLWDMNFINSSSAYVTKIFVAVLKREYRRLFKIVDLEIYGFECAFFRQSLRRSRRFNVTACEEFIFDTQKMNDKLHLNHILNRNIYLSFM
jgi:hypothetical protein